MPTQNVTQKNQQPSNFSISFKSSVSELISVAICAPIRNIDFSAFSTIEQAFAEIIDITRNRLNSETALVECYGNELTSRINTMKMHRVNETYRALRPLSPKADTLTVQVITKRQEYTPLNEISVYGARTLINLFIATYIDTLLAMAKEYDEDNFLNDALKHDPSDFWMRLEELLFFCAGYAEFDMTRI